MINNEIVLCRQRIKGLEDIRLMEGLTLEEKCLLAIEHNTLAQLVGMQVISNKIEDAAKEIQKAMQVISNKIEES